MTAAELKALISAVPFGPILIERVDVERFAQLLEREEAKADIAWVHDDDYMDDPTDHNAIVDGQVVGWAYRNTDGDWYYCVKDTGRNGTASTEAEARAAVEAAVRAGR